MPILKYCWALASRVIPAWSFLGKTLCRLPTFLSNFVPCPTEKCDSLTCDFWLEILAQRRIQPWLLRIPAWKCVQMLLDISKSCRSADIEPKYRHCPCGAAGCSIVYCRLVRRQRPVRHRRLYDGCKFLVEPED